MTRRSIIAALGSLLMGVFIAIHAPAVRADMPCYGMAETECDAQVVAYNSATQPSAGGSNAVPAVVTAEQQRFIEMNATTLPSIAAPQAPGVTGCNDEMLCLSMYSPTRAATRECTHPTVGFPTCYVLQDDGTWAREELAGTDANWVVVGTVTLDEMRTAVGEVSASIP